MMPRDLNNALQAQLKERGISMAEVPMVPGLIRDYLAGNISQTFFVAALNQAFRRKTTKIPRKAARAGHEQIPTPEIQMEWLIEDVLTIAESAKSTPPRE
jgi:hypothetical protein